MAGLVGASIVVGKGAGISGRWIASRSSIKGAGTFCGEVAGTSRVEIAGMSSVEITGNSGKHFRLK